MVQGLLPFTVTCYGHYICLLPFGWVRDSRPISAVGLFWAKGLRHLLALQISRSFDADVILEPHLTLGYDGSSTPFSLQLV